MDSLNKLIIRADENGTRTADLDADEPLIGDAHRPGGDTGRLILSAYRNHGCTAVHSIAEAYLAGYNRRAQELGHMRVHRTAFNNGVHLVLEGASDSELRRIALELRNGTSQFDRGNLRSDKSKAGPYYIGTWALFLLVIALFTYFSVIDDSLSGWIPLLLPAIGALQLMWSGILQARATYIRNSDEENMNRDAAAWLVSGSTWIAAASVVAMIQKAMA